MDDFETLASPVGAECITPGDLRGRAPVDAGLYIVWLVSSDARRDIGLEASEDVAIYVGQAGARGIRARIHGRIHHTWPQLAEILAVRGHVLFPWWLRYPFPDSRRFPRTQLAQLSQAQALAWQHAHLRWRFIPCPVARLARLEREAIEHLRPLLNRRGMGDLPPQLRTRDDGSSARSRWLWHLSWTAVVIAETQWPAQLKSASDGFPVLDSSTAVATRTRVREPSARSLRRLMDAAARAAAADVRDAVAALVRGAAPPQRSSSSRRALSSHELREHAHSEMMMWWAAHVATPLLPDGRPPSLDDALATSLNLRPVPGLPAALPDPARTRQLLRYIKRVIGERRH